MGLRKYNMPCHWENRAGPFRTKGLRPARKLCHITIRNLYKKNYIINFKNIFLEQIRYANNNKVFLCMTYWVSINVWVLKGHLCKLIDCW